ncbi:hypothetical protein EMIHUDRAFT_453113 [Emiliania huxleyi CCMP1516]|uniref:U-box domain-containing protein n=2 Tax=Emiliania huxleyi TaxID=2903 RepID=A0A0D3IAV6_EMIH1|nr:hypothetical protein EMIHUDRAFT_453113 [Emiliania huxleyi CCMP1516]EOD08391.1 hypothetical protein EMIHUDRAFT_453113 [Emiliania huxleyi CCMP1516]|eukprot:XP_005760820.1 hypothetical protein EMIHUDRAFT_453113 [Emiliania huxleyi CCMP1516]
MVLCTSLVCAAAAEAVAAIPVVRGDTRRSEAELKAEEAEQAAALEENTRLEVEAKRTPEGYTSSSVEPSPPANEEEPPDQFVCPITTEVMSDPVMAADGQSYERLAIERWLATKQTSPLTGGELDHSFLVPNHLLRRQIREWQDARYAFMFFASAARHAALQ